MHLETLQYLSTATCMLAVLFQLLVESINLKYYCYINIPCVAELSVRKLIVHAVCTCAYTHLVYHTESSHGTKELFNLPPLVLKARYLSGSAFCMSI